MAGISDYLGEKWLKDYFSDAIVYLALFKNDPGPDASGTEVSEAGYSRLEIGFGQPFDDNGEWSVESEDTNYFDEAEEDWGEVSHAGIFDSSSEGELLWYGPLKNTREILEGDQAVVRPDDIKVTIRRT